MTKLICETIVTEKGQTYYKFYVEKDGQRVEIKPKWDNALIQLYVLADKK